MRTVGKYGIKRVALAVLMALCVAGFTGLVPVFAEPVTDVESVGVKFQDAVEGIMPSQSISVKFQDAVEGTMPSQSISVKFQDAIDGLTPSQPISVKFQDTMDGDYPSGKVVVVFGAPAGEWHMDGDWLDSSGNGLNGSPSPEATFTEDGRVNSAGHFNGTGDKVTIGASPLLDPALRFSVEAWVRIASGATGNMVIAGNLDESAQKGYGLTVEGDNVKVKFGDGAFAEVGALVPKGVWAYVAGTYDGETLKIYVNGEFKDEVAVTKAVKNPGAFIIGYGAGSGYFAGDMDELAVYRRALSADEIALHYAIGSGLDVIPPSPPTVDPVEPLTSLSQITLTGTKDADSSILVNWNLMVPVNSATTWEATYTLVSGLNNLKVTSMDETGNESSSVSVTVTYDNTAPVVSVSIPEDGSHVNTFSTIDLTLEDAYTDVDYQMTAASAVLKNSGGTAVPGDWAIQGGHLIFTTQAQLADGAYTVELTPTDTFGNAQDITLGFFIDTTLPEIELVSISPDSIFRAETGTFTLVFSEPVQGSVPLSVSFGDTAPYDTFTIQGSWINSTTWKGTYTFTGDTGDGDYSISVSGASDLSGNVMTAAVGGNFVLDTVAPDTPVLATLESPVNTPDITVSGTKTAGSAIYINGSEAVSIDEQSTWTASRTLSEGSNTLTVKARDAAGNESGTASASVVLDTTAPYIETSVPVQNASLTSLDAIDIVLADATTSVDGDASISGASVKVDGSILSGAWSLEAGHFVFIPENVLTDGNYTITLNAVDVLGNTGEVTLSFALDTTPSQVESLSMSPDTPHRAETVYFTLTFNEQMLTSVHPSVTFTQGDGVPGYSISGGSWLNATTWKGSYTFTAATGDGTYTVSASGAKDRAGNEMLSSQIGSFVLDTVAPGSPAIDPVDSPTRTAQADLSGTKPAGTVCSVNGVSTGATSDALVWTYTATLSEGTNTISATCSDAAGNVSEPVTATVVYDSQAPKLVSASPVNASAIPGFETIDIALADDTTEVDFSSTLATADVKKDATAVIGSWSVVDGTLIFTPDTAVEEGSYTVSLYATDVLGNKRQISLAFTVDLGPPVVQSLAMSPTSPHRAETVTFTVTFAEDMNTAVAPSVSFSKGFFADTYTLSGSWINNRNWRGSYPFTAGTGDGEYDVKVTGGTDRAGNVMSDTVAGTFVLDTSAPAVPTVNAVTSPTNVPNQILFGTKPADTAIYINGKQRVALNTENSWSYTYPLSEGSNELNITARDGAGNISGSASASIVLDTTPPAFEIAPYQERTISSTITLTGTKEPGSLCVMNGETLFNAEDQTSIWSYTASLVEGIPNTYTFTVSDALGNTKTKTVTIYYDVSAPSPLGPGVLETDGSGSGTEVSLSWNSYIEPADAAYYRIYVSETPITDTTGMSPVGTVNKGTRSYTSRDLTEGTTYYFAVVPVDAGGNYTSEVNAATGTPQDTQAPEDVKITSVTSGHNDTEGNWILITWVPSADSAGDLVSQMVYIDDGTGYDQGTELDKAAISYKKTGLADETLYKLKVTTLDDLSHESAGAIATGVTRLANTDSLTAEPGNMKVSITWTPVESQYVDYYNVYRLQSDTQQSDVSSMILVTGTKNTSFADTGLMNDMLYQYAVTTVNKYGAERTDFDSVAARTRLDESGPVFGTVSLTDGYVVTQPLTISASASDIESAMEKVELYIDGILTATQSGESVSYFWNVISVEDGNHTVKFIAYDQYGNATELVMQVIVSLGAPSVPAITGHTVTQTEPSYVVNISGTTALDTTVSLRVNGVVVADVSSLNGTFDITGVELAEGDNLLSVKAAHRGGESAYSQSYIIVVDTGAPPAPGNLTAEPQSGGRVLLSWNKGVGEGPSGYNIYMGTAEFASMTDGGVEKVNSTPERYTFRTYTAPDDTLRYYAVTAVDSSGNESALSVPVYVVTDRVAPYVESIDFTYTDPDNTLTESATIAGPGNMKMTMTVNEPLVELPFLSLEPENGSPVIIQLTKAGDTIFTGSFTVGNQSPDGPLAYKFSGKDIVGNRGVDQGEAVTLDVKGPVASILSPLQVLQKTAGPAEVQISFNEAPLETPLIELKDQHGTSAIISGLASSDGLNWTGTVDASGLPDGVAEFSILEAKDIFGNAGNTVAGGRYITLYSDSVPAPDVPYLYSISSLKAGEISLAWNPVAGVTSYSLWRRAEGESEAVKVHSDIFSTEFTDLPPVDGTYYYSVSSVGILESESTRSDELSAISDRTGPSAPSNLSLSLDGRGVVATWDASTDSTVYGYHFYRVNGPVDSVDKLSPVVKTVITTAIDPAPTKTARYYVVAAVDDLKNPGPPSEAVLIDFPVPPVPSLTLTRVDDGAPTLTWTKPSDSIKGYHIYRNGMRITSSPVNITTYTDGLYAGGTMRYGISVVDTLDIESPVREVTLSPIDARVQVGTELRRGLLETVKLDVTSGYDNLVEFNTVRVKIGSAPESAISGSYAVEANGTLTVEKVAATAINAGDTVAVVATLEWSPEPGTSLKISRTSSAQVIGASAALEIFNDPLVRDTNSGAVRLKINNLGSSMMDVVTSEGSSVTRKVRVNLKDQDGNLLATTYLDQRTGSEIVNLSGYAVARIEPGASYISDPIDLKVPANAQAKVVIEAVISNTYYHYGKADQVTAPGMNLSVETTIQETPYRAVAVPEKDLYLEPQPVVITGQTLDNSTGEPVPDVPVRLGISVKGFDRFYDVTTDASGKFTYTFTPGANESGLYSVWAVHPDVYDRTVQSTFSIAGFRVAPRYANIAVAKGHGYDIPVKLMNVGGAPLTGLTFTTTASEGLTAYVINYDDVTLDPGETQTVTFRVDADQEAPDAGNASMIAAVNEGIEVSVSSSVTMVDLIPQISTSPSYIDTGMVGGDQKLVQFTMKNYGLDVLRNARIEGPSTPWMSLMVDRTIGDVDPGASRRIGIMLRPGADIPQGVYDDKITIYSDNHIPYNYYVQVTVSSSSVGNVFFDVLNELYEDVPDASITFQNQTLLELIYSVKTDTDGTFMVNDIPEGRYIYNISATGHIPYSGSFVVEPGLTTTVPIALEVTFIDIEWSVTPVVLEDRYEINVQQTFETQVPAPVLIIEPASVNVPALQPGEVFQGEFKVTNYGLVQLDNVRMDYSRTSGEYEIEMLSEVLPETLGAMQSVTVPYRVTRRADTGTATSSLFNEVMGYGGTSCGGGFTANVSGDYNPCAIRTATKTASFNANIGGDPGCGGKIDIDWGYCTWDCGYTYTPGDPTDGPPPPPPPPPPPGKRETELLDGNSCPTTNVDIGHPGPDADPNDPDKCTGSSVGMSSGQYKFEATDLSIPTKGGDFEWDRYYSSGTATEKVKREHETRCWWTWTYRFPGGSRTIKFIYTCNVDIDYYTFDQLPPVSVTGPQTTVTETIEGPYLDRPFAGPFGSGWTNIYFSRFETRTVTSRIEFSDYCQDGVCYKEDNRTESTYTEYIDGKGNRSIIRFFPSGRSGRWIEKTASGGYLVRDGDFVLEYDSTGKLTTVTEKGMKRNLVYSGGQLTEIQDEQGGTLLSITWANGLIKSVTDRLERTINYEYTGGLSRVTNDCGEVKAEYGYYGGRIISKTIGAETYGIGYERINLDYSKLFDELPTYGEYKHDYNYKEREYYRVGAVTKPSGSENDFSSTSNKRTYTYTDENGRKILVKLDDQGRITSEQEILATGDFRPIRTIEYSVDAETGLNVERETGSDGITTAKYTDANGNIVRTIDGEGNTAYMEYDADNRPIRITDPMGIITSIEYDSEGNLTRYTEAVGLSEESVITYTYNSSGELESVNDNGAVTNIKYNESGLPVKVFDPLGNDSTLGYNVHGQVISITDALGNTTTMTYKNRCAQKPSSVTDPLGNTTGYTYDENDNVTSVIDALGRVTSFIWNHKDKMTSITDVLGNTKTVEYNATGENPVKITEGERVIAMAYDTSGRRVSTTGPEGNTTTYSYDQASCGTCAAGKDTPSGFTDPLGNVITLGYDGARRVSTIADPLNNISQVIRNANGRPVKSIDANGNETLYEYDALERLIKQTDAGGGVTSYVYDKRGNILSITDPDGNTTTFEYDLADRVVRETRSMGQAVEYTYYDNGLLESVKNANGQIETYTYNGRNDMTKVSYSDGTTYAFGYDAVGNLTSWSGPGASGVIAYDALDRKVSETVDYGPFSKTYSYTYDQYGRKSSYTTPEGVQYSYLYDLNGQLTSMEFDGRAISYEYEWNRLVNAVLPNGITTSYQYNANSWVTDITATGIVENNYVFDGMQNILNKGTIEGEFSYDYDAVYQLVKETDPALLSESYTYDLNGNRLSTTAGQWSSNANNELLFSPEANYEYDANGNLVEKAIGGQITTYEYNAASRLVQVNLPDGQVAKYVYDPFGRRIRKDINGLVTCYTYTDEGLSGEYSSNGTLVRSYGWKPDAQWGTDPVFMQESGEYYYYHTDHLGTPVVMTDSSGTKVWNASYSAFGEFYMDEDADNNGVSVMNNLRFPGQYFDVETDFHYNWNRYYDPATGRYTQVDPIGFAGMDYNLYRYAGNNPLRFIDNEGLSITGFREKCESWIDCMKRCTDIMDLNPWNGNPVADFFLGNEVQGWADLAADINDLINDPGWDKAKDIAKDNPIIDKAKSKAWGKFRDKVILGLRDVNLVLDYWGYRNATLRFGILNNHVLDRVERVTKGWHRMVLKTSRFGRTGVKIAKLLNPISKIKLAWDGGTWVGCNVNCI